MKSGIHPGLSVVLVVLAGCGGAAPVGPTTTPEIYDFRSEGTFPPAPETSTAPASAGRSSENSEFAPLAVQTWSVQVFAGRSQEVAESKQRQLQGLVPEDVYIDYIRSWVREQVDVLVKIY